MVSCLGSTRFNHSGTIISFVVTKYWTRGWQHILPHSDCAIKESFYDVSMGSERNVFAFYTATALRHCISIVDLCDSYIQSLCRLSTIHFRICVRIIRLTIFWISCQFKSTIMSAFVLTQFDKLLIKVYIGRGLLFRIIPTSC